MTARFFALALVWPVIACAQFAQGIDAVVASPDPFTEVESMANDPALDHDAIVDAMRTMYVALVHFFHSTRVP